MPWLVHCRSFGRSRFIRFDVFGVGSFEGLEGRVQCVEASEGHVSFTLTYFVFARVRVWKGILNTLDIFRGVGRGVCAPYKYDKLTV